MMVRCSLSLWIHTGSHNTVLRRQSGDGTQQPTSDDKRCPGTFVHPVINSHQCLSSFRTDCLNACHDHSLTCAQASRLWFPQRFHFSSPFFPFSCLSSSAFLHPHPFWLGIIRSCTEFFLKFHFSDWQPRCYFPFMCILCRLRSIPATNGGDSQTTIPELVCSSLGARAVNQRLWW